MYICFYILNILYLIELTSIYSFITIFVLPGVSILGMACVSRHEMRFYGFTISAIGNILWIIDGYVTNNVSYYILFGGYLIFNLIGIHDEYASWRKIYTFNKQYNK